MQSLMSQKRGDTREGGMCALIQEPTSKHVAYYKGGRELIANVNGICSTDIYLQLALCSVLVELHNQVHLLTLRLIASLA